MFRKIGCWFHNVTCDTKNAFLKAKWHFYILLGALTIALLCAIAASYQDCCYNGNFMACIAAGDGFPIGAALWKLAVMTLSFLVVVIASCNFYFFLIGYIGYAFFAYYLIFGIICAVLSCGGWGILYILLFLIPVGLVWSYCYAIALYRIYRTVIFGTGRCFVNLFRCNRRLIFRIVLPFWFCVVLFTLALWIIESVIFFLIF